MTTTNAGWPFGSPPYHKNCGDCGWRYEAKSIDAGVPMHKHLSKEEQDIARLRRIAQSAFNVREIWGEFGIADPEEVWYACLKLSEVLSDNIKSEDLQ